jgi:hypothetical protein
LFIAAPFGDFAAELVEASITLEARPDGHNGLLPAGSIRVYAIIDFNPSLTFGIAQRNEEGRLSLALSVFVDKAQQPTDADLRRALKASFGSWNELKDRIASRFSPLTFEWGFTSQTTGWGLRLKHKERIILYMTPGDGFFLASFVLGEKAVQAAHEAKLPSSILKVIDTARKYAEGRGVRFRVTNARGVRNIERLAAIKMSN